MNHLTSLITVPLSFFSSTRPTGAAHQENPPSSDVESDIDIDDIYFGPYSTLHGGDDSLNDSNDDDVFEDALEQDIGSPTLHQPRRHKYRELVEDYESKEENYYDDESEEEQLIASPTRQQYPELEEEEDNESVEEQDLVSPPRKESEGEDEQGFGGHTRQKHPRRQYRDYESDEENYYDDESEEEQGIDSPRRQYRDGNDESEEQGIDSPRRQYRDGNDDYDESEEEYDGESEEEHGIDSPRRQHRDGNDDDDESVDDDDDDVDLEEEHGIVSLPHQRRPRQPPRRYKFCDVDNELEKENDAEDRLEDGIIQEQPRQRLKPRARKHSTVLQSNDVVCAKYHADQLHDATFHTPRHHDKRTPKSALKVSGSPRRAKANKVRIDDEVDQVRVFEVDRKEECDKWSTITQIRDKKKESEADWKTEEYEMAVELAKSKCLAHGVDPEVHFNNLPDKALKVHLPEHLVAIYKNLLNPKKNKYTGRMDIIDQKTMTVKSISVKGWSVGAVQPYGLLYKNQLIIRAWSALDFIDVAEEIRKFCFEEGERNIPYSADRVRDFVNDTFYMNYDQFLRLYKNTFFHKQAKEAAEAGLARYHEKNPTVKLALDLRDLSGLVATQGTNHNVLKERVDKQDDVMAEQGKEVKTCKGDIAELKDALSTVQKQMAADRELVATVAPVQAGLTRPRQLMDEFADPQASPDAKVPAQASPVAIIPAQASPDAKIPASTERTQPRRSRRTTANKPATRAKKPPAPRKKQAKS